MKEITIGSAKSEPGKLTYGFIDGIDHPTGIIEKIPVMIAQGTEEGPTFFLTANVHGNELTGIAVIHDLVTEELAQELKGTIVAIPTLNPSALGRYHRSPTYDERDPNRLYPERKFAEEDKEEAAIDKDVPELYEQLANKIFPYFEKYADYHIDFHNHALRSIPYAILDRIFYEDGSKKEAEELLEKLKAMVEAFGIITCTEFPGKKYLKKKLHRSVSGSTLNSLRIPAFTAELGENSVVIPNVAKGSIKGTRNVLRWAGMLNDGPMEEITEFPIPKPSERLRRASYPRAKQAGIVRFLVNPGDHVTKGQPFAKLTDILGQPIGDGIIRTDYAGYIIALRSQMAVYPGDILAEMGIKDEAPVLVPIPPKK